MEKQVTLLVTGAGGQLGRELVLLDGRTAKIVGFDRKQLDITDLAQCREVVAAVRPDAVIHAAAYTAVDRAEEEPDEAYRVNGAGTRNMVLAARENGAKFCYVSTDYVFDGMADEPYYEYDNTNPRSVYGKSKRAGEFAVQTLSDHYFIVRTSWVYGAHGGNFVKTMLKLSEEKSELTVVHDQVGSPTYAPDLAKFLVALVQTDYYGIYHASNAGTCSWYEFAKAIFEESGVGIRVEPCTTDRFPRPAPRPAYSVLAHSAIRQNGFEVLRHWRDALREFLGASRP